MKTFKSLRLSGINLTIYIILIFLSFVAISLIWNFIDDIIINPKEFNELRIDKPIISPFNDAYLYLKSEVLENNEAVYQKIQRNNFIRLTISGLVYFIFFGMLILQLRKLLYSIKQKPFFLKENFKIVKRISLLLFAWVIFDFIMYQSVQLFIPLSLVQDNYNYIPINKILY